MRVGQDRGHVGGEEVLAVADADDERHVHARADQPLGLARVHHGQRVRALSRLQRRADRVGDVPGVRLLDEVRERLGVGLGAERVAAPPQPVAQLLEVLDDAVVDDRDLARAVDVRVGVEVVRAGRASPSACARGRCRRGASGPASAVGGWPACRRASRRTGRRPVDEGDAGGVVAAVLEAARAPRSGSGRPRAGRCSRRFRTCWAVLLSARRARAAG